LSSFDLSSSKNACVTKSFRSCRDEGLCLRSVNSPHVAARHERRGELTWQCRTELDESGFRQQCGAEEGQGVSRP
jgi:hypothetical protein